VFGAVYQLALTEALPMGAGWVLLSFLFEYDREPPLVELAPEARAHGKGERDAILDLARVVCGRRNAWLLWWGLTRR
jgi:hypothetical protein